MKNNETQEPVWLICPVALTMTHHDYLLQHADDGGGGGQAGALPQ